MASIQSQIKRNRQNEKRRLRNRDYRGAARTAVKDARASLAGSEDSSVSVMAAISALDKAAQKGAIHHRNAARRKGRLLKRLAALTKLQGHAGLQAKPPSAERGARAAEQMPLPKAPAKTEKAVPPSAAQKPKSEAKKPAAKSAAQKTTEKKPAAKKSTKK